MSEYEAIKGNCENEGQREANAVSDLYQFNFYSESDVILLDMEVVLDKATNRIDLAFFDKKHEKIVFCEAKEITNNAINQSKENPNSAISQVMRYNEELKNPEKIVEIIEQYRVFVKQTKELFSIDLPEPKEIFPRTSLLILGGDKVRNSKKLEKAELLYTAENINCFHTEKATNIEEIFESITKGG